MKKFLHNESGQVLAIFALTLVALLGFSALAIDVGMMMHKRAELQKAADAAALAGIMDVWGNPATQTKGINRAVEYAQQNGATTTTAEVLTSYPDYTKVPGLLGAPIFLEVEVEATVNHFFGPIIGFDNSVIRAKAVAVKVSDWKGDSLPFVNLGTKPGSGVDLMIWNKEGPGEKESIWKSEREYSAVPVPHFKVNYLDGVMMQNGKDNSIGTELDAIWNYLQGSEQTVYVLSLRPEIFDAGFFFTDDGKKVMLPECKELKNKATIPVEELVLLEVKWETFEKHPGNNTLLGLQVVNIHEINAVPDSYDGIGEIVSYLIK